MGVPEDGLRGKYVGDLPRALNANEMADEVIAKFRLCLEAGSAIDEEITLDLPSGRRIFRSTLTPLFDNGGRIDRILAISRDITESKLAERQIGFMYIPAIPRRIPEACHWRAPGLNIPVPSPWAWLCRWMQMSLRHFVFCRTPTAL